MTVPVATGLTHDDLAAMPETTVDGLRKELIDGELYVTPSPVRRHQRAVARVVAALLSHCDAHGGEVLPAPADVRFWFVDLDEDRIDVYRLDADGRYGMPATLAPGEVLTCVAAEGFTLDAAAVLR